jgi:replicative DNA helicase
LKLEVLEFLTLSETLVAWADEYQELIAQAQAYSRRNGDEIGVLTGIAELDELGGLCKTLVEEIEPDCSVE